MIRSFKDFKEACIKTELWSAFTGKTTKVIHLWYTNMYATRYFYTNNMKEAYEIFKEDMILINK